MNRIILTIIGFFGTSSLLLVDSAVKGTALLLLATVAGIILRRDSAATRHLMWLLAIGALLVVPVLSAMLPQWRVLPEWAGIPPQKALSPVHPPAIVNVADNTNEFPRDLAPTRSERPSATVHAPAAELPDSQPMTAETPRIPETGVNNWNWIDALPLAWAIGFCVLILRLMAARLMLCNSERRGTVIASSPKLSNPANDPIITALNTARSQLQVSRPVTLLMYPDKTIPVVWGIFRYRLLLPQAAREWSAEQLRSVLLHELAHIKRRDALAQLLAQIACALHWFNPLAWLAAWRLSVERERACDDLVLASGVRPSSYAGHLLESVTTLSPVRWTQTCGLAMARKSSLEGRLLAVLSKNQSRRRVSVAIAAIALAIGIGAAVPIAMLRAADQKAADQKTGDQTGGKPQPASTDLKPKHEYAQSLFRKWQANARTDGKIPGALIGQVAREIDTFLKQSPQNEIAPKLAAIRPRLDASHDWTQADVVALFDDITAISAAPLNWAETPMEFDDMRNLKPGKPLPDDLKNAAWGAPAANGLCAAWLLETNAQQYPLGSVLKARVLFHNTGKAPVVFRTETWHQYDPHTALDAKGNAIKVSGTMYTGITFSATYRLAPGDYCEVVGHGIAIGAGKYEEEFRTGAVGAVIEAAAGDEVRLSHSVDATYGGWTRPSDPNDPTALWKQTIAERVEREAPMPQAAADREQLMRRVTLDIFGQPSTTDEIAAFVADNAPDALAKLTARLQAKPRIEPFSGKLPTGQTKFLVVAAAPNAAKGAVKLDAATQAKLKWGATVNGLRAALVIRTPSDEPNAGNTPDLYLLVQNVSDAPIHLNDTVAAPNVRYLTVYRDEVPQSRTKIDVPTQADAMLHPREAAYLLMCPRGETASRGQLLAAGMLKEPHMILVGQINVEKAPAGAWTGKLISGPTNRAAAQFDQQEAPKAPTAPAGAKLDPAAEQNFKWGQPVNGLRGAVVFRHSSERPKTGDRPDLYLVVQNVSKAPIYLTDAKVPADSNVRELLHKSEGRIMYIMGAREPALGDIMLQPGEAAFEPMFDPVTKLTAPKDATVDNHTLGQTIVEGVLKNTHESLAIRMQIDKAPPGAWTGKLVTGDATGAVAAGQPQPKDKDAQALLAVWQHHARANGNFPGGLMTLLGEKMKEFIRNNTGDASGDPYAKKMTPLVARIDATHDWKPQDVVALFDDIAAVTSIPLQTTREEIEKRTFKTGTPLPKNLANAPSGPPQPNGLRMAWLLEPRAAEYHLGTALKSRILIQNTGKDAVVFRTRMWHQGGHIANGIKIESIFWTTIGQLASFRLWPGEYVELYATGVGIGTMKNTDESPNIRVGSWVQANPGDNVTLTTGPVPMNDWNEVVPKNGQPDWWLDLIKADLAQDLPLPADNEERKHLVSRAGMELFGTPISGEEISAFVTDRDPTALDALAGRFATRPGQIPFAGDLVSAPSKFHVLPPDPDAAKKPRAASDPGQYPLGGNATFVVARRPDGDRIVNEAHLSFSSPQGTVPRANHEIKLPDGYKTWSAAWMRGGTVLWVMQNGNIRSYDFTNPAEVKESKIEPAANPDTLPKPVLDALRGAIEPPAALTSPGPPAATPR